jgi:ADP-ribose pyrophosphatase YjhB (NUDIX family)
VARSRLPDRLWKTIQASVPVFCVDVVPVRAGTLGAIEIGLILRDTPLQGARWCLIGGRLLLDETIAEAVERQLSMSVGASLTRTVGSPFVPLLVEYGRSFALDRPQDPRQHSISATLPVWMSGEGVARGTEAHNFRWWALNDLNATVMGFGQEHLLPRIASAIKSQT